MSLLDLVVMTPFAGAAATAVISSPRARARMVAAISVVQFLAVMGLCTGPLEADDAAWLGIDPLSRVMLPVATFVFACAGLYIPPYLDQRTERPNRVFTGTMLVLLGSITVAALARHLGLMWVAIEAATLCSAPLLYFNRTRPSIEATWRYLLIGSVGVALALLGTYFVAYAALQSGQGSSLLVADLLLAGPNLSRSWLSAAVVLLFVGYGTKLGLAPMHTWKPDAYGEAPGVVGTVLASSLLTCPFLAILRVYQLTVVAGVDAQAREFLLVLGLGSIGLAAAMMFRQTDVKRLLAWSSIEHAGILAVGVSLGGAGLRGSLLHLGAASLAKGALFLAAANLHRALGTKSLDGLRGSWIRSPASAGLFLAGFFATTAAPPFATFWSQLAILDAAVAADRLGLAVLFLSVLTLAFFGMARATLRIVLGEPSALARTHLRERPALIWPGILLLGACLLLGLWTPAPVQVALDDAAAWVEARP